jgi:hypothetical protein
MNKKTAPQAVILRCVALVNAHIKAAENSMLEAGRM